MQWSLPKKLYTLLGIVEPRSELSQAEQKLIDRLQKKLEYQCQFSIAMIMERVFRSSGSGFSGAKEGTRKKTKPSKDYNLLPGFGSRFGAVQFLGFTSSLAGATKTFVFTTIKLTMLED